MPCRWPTDSELYREASDKLAKQEWVNRETEEALCETSTLFIRILTNPENTLSLNTEEIEEIELIKKRHLEHRVKELSLLHWTLELDLGTASQDLEDLVKIRLWKKAEWFDANETHMNKESNARKQIQELQEKILQLGQVLESVENNDSGTIEKVLTKTQ